MLSVVGRDLVIAKKHLDLYLDHCLSFLRSAGMGHLIHIVILTGHSGRSLDHGVSYFIFPSTGSSWTHGSWC